MPLRVEDDATDPRVRVLTIDRPDARDALEHAAFLRMMRTDDAVEGPAAFAEKRPPRYRGR